MLPKTQCTMKWGCVMALSLDILLLSRPDQAWSSLKSPLDIAQINAPSQLLSPTSPIPPSYHTILSHSLILLGRNLPFISLPTHPTPVQVWRRPHRKPGEKSSVERNLPYSRAQTELHLHCWVEVLTWKLSRTRTLCRLFLMLFQIIFSPSILPAIFGLHLLTHPHSRRMCLHALTHTFMLQLLFWQMSLISREPRITTTKFSGLTYMSWNSTCGGVGAGVGVPLPFGWLFTCSTKNRVDSYLGEMHLVCC